MVTVPGEADTADAPVHSSGEIHLGPSQLAGLIVVLLLAFASPLTLPYNIGAIVTTFGALKSQAGLVATVEGMSISLASIAASRLLVRFRARTFALSGLVLVASAHIFTVFATDIATLAVLRAIGGTGTGIVVSCIMATAARSRNPEMTFGWINAAVGGFVSILALIVPAAISRGGFDGAYTLYAVFAVIAFAFLPFVPDQKAPVHTRARTPGRIGDESDHLVRTGWIALFGLGIVFFAHAGLLAFVERIGAELNISLTQIGLVMFVGGLLTIVGPLGAGFVGARFGSSRPALLLIILMSLSALVLTIGATPLGFLVSVPLLVLLPPTMMPSFLGGLATLDPSGRLAGAHPAFVTMGAALGPVVSGAVADTGGFGAVGWYTAAIFGLGLGLMLLGTYQADRIRRHA